MDAPFATTPPARVGALAAVAAGLLWTVKAGGILAFGAMPFDGELLVAGQLALAVALVALAFALRLRTPHARVGLGAAAVAFLLSLVNLASEVLARVAGVAPLAMTYVGGALALLVALVALGIATRETMPPSPWRVVPLALGLGVVPAVILGGFLAEIDERLLEVPILALAVGFLALAGTLRAAGDTAARAPAA